MPGFAVPAPGRPGGVVGGMTDIDRGYSHAIPSHDEYYYTYMWSIWNLFDNAIMSNSPLIHLRDMTLPTFTANQDTYVASSIEYKWAKSVTWEDVKVSWYDTKGMMEVIKQWRERVWSQEYGLQAADSYKKRSQLDVFLPTGKATQSWCLIGSWPKVIRGGEMTYTTSDVKLVEVVIAYDWAHELTAGSSSECP